MYVLKDGRYKGWVVLTHPVIVDGKQHLELYSAYHNIIGSLNIMDEPFFNDCEYVRDFVEYYIPYWSTNTYRGR